MGDPVEVGIAMDRIHRPKMEWKMLLFVLGLSIVGIFLQFVMAGEIGEEQYCYNVNMQILYVFAGFAVMLVFCFLDYTRIGMLSKAGASVLILLLLLSRIMGPVINGRRGYLDFYGITVSLHQLFYLYIPFFGGILYSYKNQDNPGFIKAILWMILPVFLCLQLPDAILAGTLLMIMLLQLCFVMRKGWFGQSKKRISAAAALVVGCPAAIFLYFWVFGAVYQRARILALFLASNEPDHQMGIARQLLVGSSLVGKSADNVGNMLPGISSNYILTYVFSCYGILAAVILMLLLGFFIAKIFKISLHQKNQLGQVMGIGCSLVFAVQMINYVLINLTILPASSVFFPLISYGGTGTIVSYALMGILLSIYRYQNVISVNPVIHHNVRPVKQLMQNR